jgi:hypothetical protein
MFKALDMSIRCPTEATVWNLTMIKQEVNNILPLVADRLKQGVLPVLALVAGKSPQD